jgi:hypothetical protein
MLELIYVWRLQRKEKEAMSRNDKITGDPKQPTGIHNDHEVLRMYERATDEARRVLASSDTDEIVNWMQSVPEFHRNEMQVRVNDDARHSKRR